MEGWHAVALYDWSCVVIFLLRGCVSRCRGMGRRLKTLLHFALFHMRFGLSLAFSHLVSIT